MRAVPGPYILNDSVLGVVARSAVATTGAAATLTNNSEGFLYVVFAQNITQAAQNATVTVNLTIARAFRILGVDVIKTGATSAVADTVRIYQGASGNAITDAISLNRALGSTVAAASINPTYFDIDPADDDGFIRIIATGADNAGTDTRCIVAIRGIWTR